MWYQWKKLQIMFFTDCFIKFQISWIIKVFLNFYLIWSFRFLNKSIRSEITCENLPIAFKKKKKLKNLNLDFAYFKLTPIALANIQKALNRLSQIETMNILFYRNGHKSEDLDNFFDGLRGMEKLINLDLNIAR